MRPALAVSTALVLSGSVAAVAMDRPPTQPSVVGHMAREQVRLRAHFDSVLVELASRDVTSLDARRRRARGELRRWLTAYRDAGRFPLNDRTPVTTPIFRDAHGTLCAMAYLVDRSGRRDIVDRIARTRDYAYVADLADDTALVAWLDSVGLGTDEAARIQPAYPPAEDVRGVEMEYALGSLFASGASLSLAALNSVTPVKWRGVLGLISGAIALNVGADGRRHVSHGTRWTGNAQIAPFNTAAGAVGVLAGAYALWRSPGGQPGSASMARSPLPFGLQATPLFQSAPGRPGVGIVLGRAF